MQCLHAYETFCRHTCCIATLNRNRINCTYVYVLTKVAMHIQHQIIPLPSCTEYALIHNNTCNNSHNSQYRVVYSQSSVQSSVQAWKWILIDKVWQSISELAAALFSHVFNTCTLLWILAVYILHKILCNPKFQYNIYHSKFQIDS